MHYFQNSNLTVLTALKNYLKLVKHRVLAAKLLIHRVIFHRCAQICTPPVQIWLTIPLHRLWTKSNNRARGQFECDVTWFCFWFDFFRSHARFGCCSIVCLRFHVVQIKQVDCKMSTKNVNNYN